MNLFQQQKPRKLGALAGLQNPSLMEMLQPEDGGEGEGQPPQPPKPGTYQMPPLEYFTGEPAKPPAASMQQYIPELTTQHGPPQNIPQAGSGIAPGVRSLLEKTANGMKNTASPLSPQGAILGVLGTKLSDYLESSKPPETTESLTGIAPGSLPPGAPGTYQMPPPEYFEGKIPAPKQEEPPPNMTSDEKEGALDMALGGGLAGRGLAGTQDLLTEYAKAAQKMQGAKDRTKAEYESTPELDQLISESQRHLADTRANRKQPGLGEFLTMALLNLGGMHHADSANLVLGLNNQREDELRAEDRLAQLEGGRASSKMGARRELRGMEQHDKYQRLQNALRQQEESRKQANSDREFNFKGNKLWHDKLMQELGQLRQQIGTEMDPGRRKKLQETIDKLDPYGTVQKQMQQRPQDDRQSRMFGDLIGGGFA